MSLSTPASGSVTGPTLLPAPVGVPVDFASRAKFYGSNGLVPVTSLYVMTEWYKTYVREAAKSGKADPDPVAYAEAHFTTLLELVKKSVVEPPLFECYHQRIREPFDYYKFGMEFARPLIDLDRSVCKGVAYFVEMERHLERGDNVVILANHQSEGDPHALDAVMSEIGGIPKLAEEMIFMAGDRVREDPLVAPFTLGRNLLNVYSKKHLDDVPELRAEKQIHNRKAVKMTQSLFKEGGKCVWFAPSGGRDRRSAATGKVEIAPFDADAVEMMRVTAARSGVPTHFYPMALATYNLLPPPPKVDKVLGESRTVTFTPVWIATGPEVDFGKITPSVDSGIDKVTARRAVALSIQGSVESMYHEIGGMDQ